MKEQSFEEMIVNKIDNAEMLTERELRRVRDYEIDEIIGESDRWTRSVETICELCGRYFALNWEEGLTEMQENEFHKQPYEVKKVKKVVTVTEWISINEK